MGTPWKKYNRPRHKRRRARNYVPKPVPTKPTTMTAFSQQKKVRMKYVMKQNFNPTTAITYYTYRANSINDPDKSGTGHQALGHDQWAAFYNHYQVIGSQIKVTALPSGYYNQSGVIWGIRLSDADTFTFSSESDLIESGQTNYKLLGFQDQTAQMLKQSFSASKYFNQKAPIDFKSQNLYADFNGNPTEEAFFQVWVKTLDDLEDPPEIDLLVEIDYIVNLQEPKNLSIS